MRVKMILPALVEAKSPFWRPIKYSLFPPLGLAALAGYLKDDDEAVIQDEHVEELDFDDNPDIVVLQVYITSAYRAYEIADSCRKRGIYVAMGGIHATSMPHEASLHADSVFIGPGEDIWPEFLSDYKNKAPKKIYKSRNRTLTGQPKARRDLIKKERYLVPNSIVVSRGCPYKCDFCYKEKFFEGGKSFYTKKVDEALQEINSLSGRHLFFLDDHLFANVEFASSLFEGMSGMGRLWQAAGTVESVLKNGLLEKAVKSGLRSLFIGFENLSKFNLEKHNKYHNLNVNYEDSIKKLRDNGVMINGSFIFGMDDDDESVFERTVDWAVENGIETATFHILTPYPGTALFERLKAQKRIIRTNYNFYDTRHAVFLPSKISPETLENGYWKSYEKFYKWRSILKSAMTKEVFSGIIRHIMYSGGWKKLEPLWNPIVKFRLVGKMRPILEDILTGFGKYSNRKTTGIIKKNKINEKETFS